MRGAVDGAERADRREGNEGPAQDRRGFDVGEELIRATLRDLRARDRDSVDGVRDDHLVDDRPALS
jgi:hypothetical protein